jgi:hypothetical protein
MLTQQTTQGNHSCITAATPHTALFPSSHYMLIYYSNIQHRGIETPRKLTYITFI